MTTFNVGMGETKISKESGSIIVAPGLGSCIGFILYDVKNKIGGMSHIVLPDSTSISKEVTMPGKYANTAVPDLLEKLIAAGANKANLRVVMAGGAQMFTIDKGSNVLNIGMRNTIAAKNAIAKANLTLETSDTGGNKGRTLRLEISTGNIYVRNVGQPEILLGGNKCQKY
jgi:chemotaxis protein CheD